VANLYALRLPEDRFVDYVSGITAVFRSNAGVRLAQALSSRAASWAQDNTRETRCGQKPDKQEARISLPIGQAKLGRMWKGMVIAVPVFAKGQQAEPRQIVALHWQSLNVPILMAPPVCKVADHPMAEQRNGDAQTDAP
jgi:hypothetical protein